jgi:aspartate/tyrosine/aromatic aminotransferase
MKRKGREKKIKSRTITRGYIIQGSADEKVNIMEAMEEQRNLMRSKGRREGNKRKYNILYKEKGMFPSQRIPCH